MQCDGKLLLFVLLGLTEWVPQYNQSLLVDIDLSDISI